MSSDGSSSPARIDVYSDVVCPWCFIGSRRLQAVLDAYGPATAVDVSYRPYMLHPDAPPGGIDLKEMLAAKYGMDPERMFDRVVAAAREEDIALDFSGQRRTYSTLAAHTLLRHARARGTQRALSDALFAAYFLRAKDVSDVAVLESIARDHGFAGGEAARLASDSTELEETAREADDARRAGIRGVPFFVFNGAYAISGAQPRTVFRQAIERATRERPPD